MAAVTPNRALLRSCPDVSLPHPTGFRIRRRAGLETKLVGRGIGWKNNEKSAGRREPVTTTTTTTKKRMKAAERGWAVRCTAEGMEMEKGMLMGGIGRETKIMVPERFKVVTLLALVMCLCNADRVVMSVAIVPLAAKHGWSSSFLGVVQVPAFQFFYHLGSVSRKKKQKLN